MKFECTNYKNVGYIMVNSGKIDITDPCYDRDTWCRMNDIAVKPGKYRCYVSILKGRMAKEWGKRIVSMMIVHSDADLSKPLGLNEIGSVGVDAGLMSIAESGVKPDYPDDRWMECIYHLDDLEKNARNGIGAFVTTKFSLGKNPKKQFWSSSGFGDGVYGVYGVDSNDQEAKEFTPDTIQVMFIEPFDDEDEKEEDTPALDYNKDPESLLTEIANELNMPYESDDPGSYDVWNYVSFLSDFNNGRGDEWVDTLAEEGLSQELLDAYKKLISYKEDDA